MTYFTPRHATHSIGSELNVLAECEACDFITIGVESDVLQACLDHIRDTSPRLSATNRAD